MTEPIVRKIDELGRVVLPLDMRNEMSLQSGDDIEIWFDRYEKMVIIGKKHQLKL